MESMYSFLNIAEQLLQCRNSNTVSDSYISSHNTCLLDLRKQVQYRSMNISLLLLRCQPHRQDAACIPVTITPSLRRENKNSPFEETHPLYLPKTICLKQFHRLIARNNKLKSYAVRNNTD